MADAKCKAKRKPSSVARRTSTQVGSSAQVVEVVHIDDIDRRRDDSFVVLCVGKKMGRMVGLYS